MNSFLSRQLHKLATATFTKYCQYLPDSAAELMGATIAERFNPWANVKYFKLWESQGMHVTPVHFYFPIPDTRTLPDSVWTTKSKLAGIDMNESFQLHLLTEVFPRFREECNQFGNAPTPQPYDFYFLNDLFDGMDALVFYCLIRHFEPKMIVEIGSGFSSRIAAKAAIRNGSTRLICIDAFPDEVLKKGFPGMSELREQQVQNIDPDFFQQLGRNDMLFIDTSHVVRIGGEVNYLFLEILPILKPGVIVHIHDIFFPFEYRKEWVLGRLNFWNEQYLLQAFLCFNSEYEVLFSCNYLSEKYMNHMRTTFPNSPWWGGCSIWIRRKER